MNSSSSVSLTLICASLIVIYFLHIRDVMCDAYAVIGIESGEVKGSTHIPVGHQ